MYEIRSFYKFVSLQADSLKTVKERLREVGLRHRIEGLFLIGPEGINATFSSSQWHLSPFVNELEILFGSGIKFKESQSEKRPFYSLRISIKPEIVTSWHGGSKPVEQRNHLSPKEWQQMLLREEVQIIDTRNYYEFEVGHFKGAINPNIKHFVELPNAIDQLELSKDKPTLIYCTGGIRCEKAIDAFADRGFKSVYQLEGGILNYFKETDAQDYVGECFVFDDRVAVDAKLQPTTKYVLCAMCGQPGSMSASCCQCSDYTTVCQRCVEAHASEIFCSKNCSHHYSMRNAPQNQGAAG